jgi:hypothetical protein
MALMCQSNFRSSLADLIFPIASWTGLRNGMIDVWMLEGLLHLVPISMMERRHVQIMEIWVPISWRPSMALQALMKGVVVREMCSSYATRDGGISSD